MVRALALAGIILGAAALLLARRGHGPLSIRRRMPIDAGAGAGFAPPAPRPCDVPTQPAPAASGAPVAAGAPGATTVSGVPVNAARTTPARRRPPNRNNAPSHFAGPFANAARRTGTNA